MSDQISILKLVATRLDEARISYMVSGSVAMNFYAQPRMTRDIDIVIELFPKDAPRICGLFAADFYVDEQDIRESIANQGLFNIIHNETLVKVDFIIRKTEAYRKEEFKRRRSMSLEGAAVSVVAPEDLLLSKLCWGKESSSEMQLRDVRNILSSAPDLDWAYVDRWAADLGVAGLLKDLRAR